MQARAAILVGGGRGSHQPRRLEVMTPNAWPGPRIPANGFEERGSLNSVGAADYYHLSGTVTALLQVWSRMVQELRRDLFAGNILDSGAAVSPGR